MINLYVPHYFPEENWSFSSSEGVHVLLFEKHVRKKERKLNVFKVLQSRSDYRKKKLKDSHRNFMLMCNSINLT